MWLAAVSFFDKHQCQVWFGSPTEVWGGISNSNGISYSLQFANLNLLPMF